MGSVINRNELRIIGMSRSGNHAIIHWVLSQARGRHCFLNCCEGKSNPFRTAREMDNGRCYRSNIDELDLDRERAGEFTRKDWLLFSHEDNYLGNACSQQFEQHHDRWVGRSQRRCDVLVLRDPFNLFASRLRQELASVSLRVAAKIWKQHARQFLEGPRRLRQHPVLVLYNQWVSDWSYRRSIAEAVGVPFSDAGIERVSECAGGSSFDGRAHDGAPWRMDLFGRWRRYLDDPAYVSIFDDQMLEMTRALFGEVGGAEEAVRSRKRSAARAAK